MTNRFESIKIKAGCCRGFHVKLGQKKGGSHQFAHFQLSMDAFNMNGSTSGKWESGPFLHSMFKHVDGMKVFGYGKCLGHHV